MGKFSLIKYGQSRINLIYSELDSKFNSDPIIIV